GVQTCALPIFSVIGPCYNERDNLLRFIESVEDVLNKEEYDYEIVIVNDGSTDGSAQLLEELSDNHARLRVIHLIRNFGQQAAMLAGIGEAKGRILITMDTDLQHPAMVIPEMTRKWEQGADVVYGIPIKQVTSDEDPMGLRPPYRLSS